MVIKITEIKKEVNITEKLGIVWKDKITGAEWLAEQPEAIRSQYNSWIRLMTKGTKEGHISDKQIRLLPIKDFLSLIKDFLKQFDLMADYSFFET